MSDEAKVPEMVRAIIAVKVPADISAKITEDHWFRLGLLIQDAIKLAVPDSENRHYVSAWKDGD